MRDDLRERIGIALKSAQEEGDKRRCATLRLIQTAVKDREFVTRAVEHNDAWLPWLTGELEKLGLQVTPSVGNFILVHFPDEDGKRAVDADAYLLERGCVLRQVGNYGLPNALRMTVGSEQANRTVLQHLKEFLGQA